MPELPDLVHVEAVLRRSVCGLPIVEARVGDPVVLRLMVPDPFPAVLKGKCIGEVNRRGQFLRFDLDGGLCLVVNAMLTGRYSLAEVGARSGRDLILALAFSGGTELRYSDESRMGKIYVARADQADQIPGFATLGVDLLSDGFTLPHVRRLVAGRRDQVRQFLLDKTALASIGNAYADEILFAARLHPKTFCHKLQADEVDSLFAAIRETLNAAIYEIEVRNQPIEVKVRDFLKVRGRAGAPCLVCGTTIRRVRVGRDDACFCPTCQPTERKLFVDFRKVPRTPRQKPIG
ncbi:MAG TPA: DNA-formamidopyrimidine glycosylase family protein [Polyangia bacterium]|nr:DNA-formamidopyrimidine glycosylase family protein [Polyangia bacterium]